MTVFLWCFTIFNFMASAGALARAVRLGTREGKVQWKSAHLYRVALGAAWTFPVVAFAATALAWSAQSGGDAHFGAAIIVAPVAWLFLMGAIFAVVDFAEDGILGNAFRKRKS